MKEISRALLEKPQAFPKLLPLKTEQIGPSFSQTLIWIQEKSKALDSMTEILSSAKPCGSKALLYYKHIYMYKYKYLLYIYIYVYLLHLRNDGENMT